MHFITKITAYVFLITACMFTASAHAQTSANQPGGIPLFTKMKEYRFPSGVCTVQQSAGLPDMITYVTTMAKFVAVPEIEFCLRGLVNAKWTVMQFDPVPAMNTLREARTENMACTQVGFVQSPIMYMVRFSNYTHTGKQTELEQCLLDMYKAKDLVQSGSINQHL